MTDWAPFSVVAEGERADPPRSLDTDEGVADRMRTAAFAEVQARDAFLWASEHFRGDAPESLCRAWRALAQAEQRHLDWLMRRMSELGIDPAARRVSDQLWRTLVSCKSAAEFAIYMATAEERGRRAGERFHAALSARDPLTAGIFGKIAEEEVSHIELAYRYFPAAASAPSASPAS